MSEPKEFYYARNQTLMLNKTFLTEQAAFDYCLPRGVVEKFSLVGDYYYYEKTIQVGTTRRDDLQIRNFGSELPGKKLHREFIKWLLGIPS